MLSGIRTVASLNSEEIELARYGKHLDGAYTAGVKEGMSKGIGNGMLFTSFYMSYALAFWFGTRQVCIVCALFFRSGCKTPLQACPEMLSCKGDILF